nr:MAG TPA: hypothetical protein [Caudoviricetes sp.]
MSTHTLNPLNKASRQQSRCLVNKCPIRTPYKNNFRTACTAPAHICSLRMYSQAYKVSDLLSWRRQSAVVYGAGRNVFHNIQNNTNERW